MSNLTLLVLAAGVGSRYGGNKQLDGIGPNGEIVLDYSVYDAAGAGFDKVVFVIREELEETFREHFRKASETIDIRYAHQKLTDLPEGISLPSDRIKPWGTGHAVLAAKDHIDGPFVVINADDFYGKSSYKLAADYFKTPDKSADYNFCMLAFKLANTLSKSGTVSRGICEVDANGFLKTITERTKVEDDGSGNARYLGDDEQWHSLPGDTPTSMNMMGFTPGLFSELDNRFRSFLEENKDKPKSEFFLPFVVDELIRENSCQMRVLQGNEKWFGMTYREDREDVMNAVRELTAKGAYPENLIR